jgi:hypothetical protein
MVLEMRKIQMWFIFCFPISASEDSTASLKCICGLCHDITLLQVSENAGGILFPRWHFKNPERFRKAIYFFLVLRRNSLKEGLAGVPDKKSF